MWKTTNSLGIKVEKQGKVKIPNFSKAGSMRNFINGQLSKYGKSDTPEALQATFILTTISKAYNHFHPEITLSTEIDSWKGKSSFQLLQEVDRLIVIKFQKPNKESQAKEIRTEISKEEIIAIIESLNNLNEGQPIKSKIIAMDWSNRLGLGHSGFKTGNKPFFSDRRTHNRFTLLLDALDKLQLIKYLGGIVNINNKIELQQVLLS